MQQRLTFITLGVAGLDRSQLLAITFGLIWPAFTLSAQNLVPNPGFEQFGSCPFGNVLDSALFWFNPTPGGAPNGTPNYFHGCAADVPENFAGTQAAHGGLGYAGFATYSSTSVTPSFREYIEVPLTEPLMAAACYELRFHVSLADEMMHATCNMGALFSDVPIIQSTPGPLLFPPSLDALGGCLVDSEDWTMVSGIYQAQGGESYLVIGNFHFDSTTTALTVDPDAYYGHSYYLIDDVSLTQLPGSAGCFSVGVAEQAGPSFSVFPNPVIDELSLSMEGNELIFFTLFDARGLAVARTSFMRATKLSTGHLAQGPYVYELRDEGGHVARGTLIKQ